MIVDDDRDIRETMAALFEDEGYLVRTAANGVEAFEALGQDQVPDLIILDLFMPRMDGRAFREAQLAREDLAAIPTVLLTASLENPLMGLPFLRKPIEASVLLHLAQKHCRRKSNSQR